MPRMTIYMPEELYREVKAARLNVSELTQRAAREALGSVDLVTWLRTLPDLDVSRDVILEAMSDVRGEAES